MVVKEWKDGKRLWWCMWREEKERWREEKNEGREKQGGCVRMCVKGWNENKRREYE